MSWLSLASIALTAQAVPAPAPPPANAPLERIATTSGYVSGADDDALGTRIKLNDARRLLTALRATRGRASAETLDLACRVPWRNWTRTRPRSALPPAAGS